MAEQPGSSLRLFHELRAPARRGTANTGSSKESSAGYTAAGLSFALRRVYPQAAQQEKRLQRSRSPPFERTSALRDSFMHFQTYKYRMPLCVRVLNHANASFFWCSWITVAYGLVARSPGKIGGSHLVTYAGGAPRAPRIEAFLGSSRRPSRKAAGRGEQCSLSDHDWTRGHTLLNWLQEPLCFLARLGEGYLLDTAQTLRALDRAIGLGYVRPVSNLPQFVFLPSSNASTG